MLASGVALAANFVGTDRKDTIDATDTADIIIGKWGDDTIKAKGGNDYIYGDYNYDNRNFDNPRSNHDTIDAGAGADYIDGGDQADDITAGPLLEVDQDTVLGQHGNDQIDTANYPASLDYVYCGIDTDYAIADPLDVVANDCENLLRISERSSTRITGYLQRPSTPYVKFDSYQESGLGAGVLPGGQPYDKETTSVVTLDDDTLQGDENRISIKLTVNPEEKTMKQRVITAQGASRSLTTVDRQALNLAAFMLQKSLARPDNNGQTNQEALVLRHLSVILESPYDHGFPDFNMEYEDPVTSSGSTASRTNLDTKGMPGFFGVEHRCAPGAREEVASASFLGRAKSGTATFRPIQYYTDPDGEPLTGEYEGGEDITYLDCYETANTVTYDSADQEEVGGATTYDEEAGEATGDSFGRCGPEGSYYLEGGYAKDCLDHDACVRDLGTSAGPTDADCGDEFFEAFDDTVAGPEYDECSEQAQEASVRYYPPKGRDPSLIRA